MAEKRLREGYTTGSSASAAAGAALRLLLMQQTVTSLEIALPPFLPENGATDEPNNRKIIPVHSVILTEYGAVGSVIKDGGDDPDATHGLHIEAHVSLLPDRTEIILEGGKGVGKVTLPGLPVPAGNPAINPEPQEQIKAAVREACAAAGYAGGVKVRIVVPKGEEQAKHTMNSRLGILGGISILGTRGTVKPYSHSSWKATVLQGMDVALAAGAECIGFSTGRRSERLLMEALPDWKELAFVQAADFAQFSLESAAEKGFKCAAWSCFFGKLVKLAQGHAYTHAKTAPIDFVTLAAWCQEAGINKTLLPEIINANTARQVLDIISNDPKKDAALHHVATIARDKAQHWAKNNVKITVYLFDFDGSLLTIV
ncbi:cobalt-precorrin-5B (C(1))-methyltransferase CbiD [Halodesulfovibrio sp.]|jgi:cobalt-precorrin-5B (C1)-methyltransferase|uniref:cobalt-precorrin-5B (C(1))-methyltransferase CbiD n=1 Tax=Halodesulfovibrio sp. TaxID=1912772 RepID=UPI0025DA87E5|nr:cobalt-precorrin-5B (C(1))-methyltransferase CbiD [Halodesulfovibrio sp.]MCT4626196.1 cobalt-precorrin-5B (C(1))-methyltransferase CbiD [Halodesulfovibrio sp.]